MPRGSRSASTRRETGRSRPSSTPTPRSCRRTGRASRGTRAGTGSSTAARCTRRWPRRAAELGIVVASPARVLVHPGRRVRGGVPGSSDQLYAYRVLAAGRHDRGRVLRRPGDQPPTRCWASGTRCCAAPAGGRVLGPGEDCRGDALALYTRQAAYAMRRETEIGSLAVGHRADFVVLDGNPLTIDPERITDLSVLATALDGVPVHQDGVTIPG